MAMELSRRSFLTGTSVLAAGAFTAGALGTKAFADEVAADEVEWEEEVDVVIVGTGFAGLSAALTLATESPDTTYVVLEAGSEEEVGGNSRCCGQVLHYIDDYDAAVAYLTACNGQYTVKEEYVQAWAEGIIENYDWLNDVCDAGLEPILGDSAEFPEYEGADHVIQQAVEGSYAQYEESWYGVYGGTLWNAVYDSVMDYDPDIVYETRVVDLALDSETREIIGVISEDGRYFKARQGVILACGGFAANPEMERNYIVSGYPRIYSFGTPYNVGDGINMGVAMGANLWHMNNIAGAKYYSPSNADWPDYGGNMSTTYKDYVFIGPKGKRFMYEERTSVTRHGKMDLLGGGVLQLAPCLTPAWVVFGSEKFENETLAGKPYSWPSNAMQATGYSSNEEALEQGLIVTADTLEELAELMGLGEYADNFVETINTYNDEYVANQLDADFGRGQYYYDEAIAAQTSGGRVEAFELTRIEAPYYAAPIIPGCFNTQGGPERNQYSQVIDVRGNVIPRLYTAGELSAIYSNDYNGGGNVAECIRTGRTAARNIVTLDSWE